MRILFHLIFSSYLSLVSFQASATGEYRFVPVNQPKNLPALRLGPHVITRREGIGLDQVGVDEENTLHIFSMYANGTILDVRVSRRGAVKQWEIYNGWPYLIDRRSRLYALDASFASDLKAKLLPAATARPRQRYLAASGTAVASAMAAYAANLLAPDALNPLVWGTTGFFGFVTVDWLRSIFKKSVDIGPGGDYFTTLLAKNVDRLEYDRDRDDFVVHFIDKDQPQAGLETRLSNLAPSYTKYPLCVYELMGRVKY